MTHLPDVSRRTAIVASGVGTALLLAACAPTPTAPSDGSPVNPTPSGSAPDAGGATSGPTGGNQVEVALLSDIPVGGSISATLDGDPILLAQPVAGTVVAFSAICTHQGCVVLPAKTEFDCPCHGSRYDAATGAVLDGPAPSPLPEIAVTLDGDSVRAG
ncbi:Rieske (2Fe-2S) protein [Leifsonia kafniensis]|uniref:Cytochrome bc1 complex Rieske iron-sulfur subunit n=1 Tax=Leifsonia kafniensis TaxID=475957 RepID=A0ABP7K8B0_9MICO